MTDSNSLSAGAPDGRAERPGALNASALLRVGCALLLCVAAIRIVQIAVGALTSSSSGTYDFSVYFVAALALRDNIHANIFDPAVIRATAAAHQSYLMDANAAYLYPPLLAFVFIPLTYISFAHAALFWMIVNLLMWLAATVILASWLSRLLARTGFVQAAPMRLPAGERGGIVGWWSRLSDADVFAITVAAFLSLLYAPITQALQLGQVSILLLLLIVLVPWLLQRDRPALAGAALALATLIKVFPVLLIVYFVARRRWDVVLPAVAVLAGTTLVLLPILGLDTLRNSVQIFTSGSVSGMQYNNHSLQQVPMWLAVLFGAQPASVPDFPGYILLVLAGLAFVAALALAYRDRRAFTVRVNPATASTWHAADEPGYVFAVASMLVVSPLVWEHYDAWLVPVVAYCLIQAARLLSRGRAGDRNAWRTAMYVLAGAALAYALTMTDLPLNFDHEPGFSRGPVFLFFNVRPIFMLFRPAASVLAWLAAGLLFIRAVRVPVAVRQAQVEQAEQTEPDLRPNPLAVPQSQS